MEELEDTLLVKIKEI